MVTFSYYCSPFLRASQVPAKADYHCHTICDSQSQIIYCVVERLRHLARDLITYALATAVGKMLYDLVESLQQLLIVHTFEVGERKVRIVVDLDGNAGVSLESLIRSIINNPLIIP